MTTHAPTLTVAPLPAADEEANAQLRAVLTSIPDGSDYGPWWGSAEGLALMDQIRDRAGRPIIRVVARLYSVPYEPDDIAHTAIDVLSRRPVRDSVVASTNTWGYLYRVLRREIVHQVGPFFRADNEFDHITIPDPADRFSGPHTDLRTAIEQTVLTLTRHTPAEHHNALPTVVEYLGDRSGDRLSRACTEITQEPTLAGLGLSAAQLRAITNAVLGSRPKFAETSILGGFIRNAAWNPYQSATHQAALRRYESRMTRTTNSGHLALVS